MKSLQFFKGLSWLIFLNLLVKPVWLFFIDRQVQNIVGYEEYGKYFAILNLSYVLFFLSDAGLSNMLNQRMAHHTPFNLVQLFRLKFFLLLFYFAVFCLLGWVTQLSNWKILLYVVGIQSLTSLLIFFRNVVTANQYFTADAWISIIDKSLMILFCGSIIYSSFFGNISLLLFLRIQLVCTALAVIVSLLFILSKKLITVANEENVVMILKKVAPFASIILLMSMHYRLDGFLLERIHPHGAMEAGIYASAYRLLDASNMVGYLASSFLVAFIARHLKEKELLQDAIFNTRHILMFCAVGVTTFVIVFASWLQQLLYHTNGHYNALVMQLCMAAFPGYCMVHVYGSVLTGAAKFKSFITILVLSVAVNILLNLGLIPYYGAAGCCISAIVSQYFCGLATFFVSAKALSISFNSKSIMVYLFTALVLFLFFYFGKNAVVNIWLILGVAISFSLLLLITQLSFFRKSVISLR
jgi:O-antigen/teichoic acid export membrane protein